MAKLVFLVACGAGLILLIAYGANAEFNVLQGLKISDAQQNVIAGLLLAGVILGSAISFWLKYWGQSPRQWK